jgi:transposase
MIGKRYNDTTNARIKIIFKYGHSVKKIMQDTGVSKTQIYRKKEKLEIFELVNPQPLIKQGRPKSLTKNIKEIIVDFMNEYPQTYINKIVAFVWEKFDVHIDENTIKKALTRIRLIYKKVEIVNSEQNEELRIK